MRVQDLQPGMEVVLAGVRSTFITMSPHPLYPQLAMVIWVMDDDHPGFGPKFGRVSIDALSPLQDVGGVDPKTNDPKACYDRLLQVLLHNEVQR
jgi:hypothetical protein